MKLSRTVALGLFGWYLLLPPLRPLGSIHLKGGAVQFDPIPPTPLSEWDIAESFDSARECRNAHKKLLGDRVVQRSMPTGKTAKDITELEQAYNAKCVGTDDPRLK